MTTAEAIMRILSILVKSVLLIIPYEFGLPISLGAMVYATMNLSRIILPVKLLAACMAVIISGSVILSNHERVDEHAPVFEYLRAAVWTAGVIIPMNKTILSSGLSAVLAGSAALVSVFSCRYYIKGWRRKRSRYADYGNRTKEELVSAVIDMSVRALYEDIEESFKEEIRDIKREAEQLLSSGVYDMSTAKALYTKCRGKIAGAEAFAFMNHHSGTNNGSFRDAPPSAGQIQRNYFIGISTEEALDKKFRELAKTMHPDNGGDAVLFAEMQKEYRELKSSDYIIKKKTV